KKKKKSDLDILIDFYEKPDFFEYMEIEEFLSRILKTKVDLVMKSALKPHIGKYILQEEKFSKMLRHYRHNRRFALATNR
ncbi:MAG: nucleotidyltransferase domain-containing protein, partial [Ignavibacteriales bacterium]|nr:nucleotidyltransferase domain-containing protein [Ignavibacteriales bacterium]